jgi:hypothetical protein
VRHRKRDRVKKKPKPPEFEAHFDDQELGAVTMLMRKILAKKRYPLDWNSFDDVRQVVCIRIVRTCRKWRKQFMDLPYNIAYGLVHYGMLDAVRGIFGRGGPKYTVFSLDKLQEDNWSWSGGGDGDDGHDNGFFLHDARGVPAFDPISDAIVAKDLSDRFKAALIEKAGSYATAFQSYAACYSQYIEKSRTLAQTGEALGITESGACRILQQIRPMIESVYISQGGIVPPPRRHTSTSVAARKKLR